MTKTVANTLISISPAFLKKISEDTLKPIGRNLFRKELTMSVLISMQEQKQVKKNKLVLVVSKGTADAIYPAFILATTAVSQGMEVFMYFTFGGMKVLTKDTRDTIEPSKDLGIDKGTLQSLVQKGGMPTIPQMLEMAMQAGVHINACSPTMKLFGTTKESLVSTEIPVVGAATFLEWASDPEAITLFI
jgi:peroxiredoxin family protein